MNLFDIEIDFKESKMSKALEDGYKPSINSIIKQLIDKLAESAPIYGADISQEDTIIY